MKIIAMVSGISGNADVKAHDNVLTISGTVDFKALKKYSKLPITVFQFGRWSVTLPYIYMGWEADHTRGIVHKFECAVGIVDFQVDERCSLTFNL